MKASAWILRLAANLQGAFWRHWQRGIKVIQPYWDMTYGMNVTIHMNTVTVKIQKVCSAYGFMRNIRHWMRLKLHGIVTVW